MLSICHPPYLSISVQVIGTVIGNMVTIALSCNHDECHFLLVRHFKKNILSNILPFHFAIKIFKESQSGLYTIISWSARILRWFLRQCLLHNKTRLLSTIGRHSYYNKDNDANSKWKKYGSIETKESFTSLFHFTTARSQFKMKIILNFFKSETNDKVEIKLYPLCALA